MPKMIVLWLAEHMLVLTRLLQICCFLCQAYIYIYIHIYIYIYIYIYIHTHEGWNFNSGNYLFTTDTK